MVTSKVKVLEGVEVHEKHKEKDTKGDPSAPSVEWYTVPNLTSVPPGPLVPFRSGLTEPQSDQWRSQFEAVKHQLNGVFLPNDHYLQDSKTGFSGKDREVLAILGKCACFIEMSLKLLIGINRTLLIRQM